MCYENGSDIENIKNLPIEQKLRMLSEEDKLYLTGFIDRALLSNKRKTEDET